MTLEPERIVEAILEAMADAGRGGRELAEELGSAVVHFLEQFDPDGSGLPGDESEDGPDESAVQDMIEKVLMETGHREIARAFVLRRDRRMRRREQIRVLSGDEVVRAPEVETRGDDRFADWERGRIVDALIEEAGLDGEAAQAVAQAVEDRVLESSLETISTSLVRELVDNELLTRGYTQSLGRQTSLAVPKYDLERILFHGGDPRRGLLPGSPKRVARWVGDRILREYALETAFSLETRRALSSGALHFDPIDEPLQLLAVRLPADGLDMPSRPGRFESTFRRVVRAVRRLEPSVSREIRFDRLAEALARDAAESLEREGLRLGPEDAAKEWLEAIEAWRLASEGEDVSGADLVFSIPLEPVYLEVESPSATLFAEERKREECALFLAQTLRQLVMTERGRDAVAHVTLRLELGPRTFDDRRFRTVLDDLLRSLPAGTPLRFARSPEVRSSHAEVISSRAVLNLPRIAHALQSGEGADASRRHRAVVEAAGTVARALTERATFERRVALHPDGPWAKVLGISRREDLQPERWIHGVGVVGLDETVRILLGKSLHEGDVARRLGREIVESLAGAVEAFSQTTRTPEGPERVQVRLEEAIGRGPLRRFVELDRELYPTAFASRELRLPRAGKPYTSGVRLASWAPVDPLENDAWVNAYRDLVELEEELDGTLRMRSEGPEVLFAYLEEIVNPTGGNPPRTGEESISSAR